MISFEAKLNSVIKNVFSNTPTTETSSDIDRKAFDAYNYAVNVIGGRWPEGEKDIAKNAEMSFMYAKNIIKGKFPEGEEVLSKSPGYAVLYAIDVIKDRFPAAEKAILTTEYILHKRYKRDYINFLKSKGIEI
jgi:hypothetical protein